EYELMFVHFETENIVGEEVIYPSNGILHEKSMDPSFLKIQVIGRMSSNDFVSLPTSISPLTSPTTSAPVFCQTVQQEFESQSTSSWGGSKESPPIQEEDNTIEKCMEVLPAWSGSKKTLPTRNENNTIDEGMALL
ncbi:hypothetical protein Tco_0732915, partial [Tanacetum coccineum]